MFVYTRYIFAKVIGLPVTDAAMCGSGGVGGSSLATIHTDACMGEGETFEMYYYILGLDVVFIISYLFCFVFIKDRVGMSGRVLVLRHLNVNIFLNILGRNTYNIPKDSSFPHLFSDIMYYCVLQDWL